MVLKVFLLFHSQITSLIFIPKKLLEKLKGNFENYISRRCPAKFYESRANRKGDREIENSELRIQHSICHTGQHYDAKMSEIFFAELELPEPDFYLGIGGGIQEETTFLGVPCVTLRKTTERPVTAEIGTNYLVGEDFSNARSHISEILKGQAKKGIVPELWDGKAAERIVNVLLRKEIKP